MARSDHLKDFDPADFLDGPEIVVEYLNLALAEDQSPAVFGALSNVARARGREDLAKLASITGDLSTFLAILAALELGLKVACKPRVHKRNSQSHR